MIEPDLYGSEAETDVSAQLAAVESALSMAGPTASVVVDLDETLLRGNSTELFLSHVRPALFAALILRALDVLKPWRLWPGADRVGLQDRVRVGVILVLMPWHFLVWRRLAARLAQDQVNKPLLTLLESAAKGRVVVATHGFGLIVRPLINHLGFAAPPKVICGGLAPWDGMLRRGKTALVEDHLGAEGLTKAVVITDDETRDADLLAASNHPVGGVWPNASYHRAFSDFWLPLDYVTKVKHPGRGHVKRTFLGEDWLVLLLAAAPLSVAPLSLGLGLLFLILAYFVIYDLGYWENDRLGVQYESNPVVGGLAAQWRDRVKPMRAWALCLILLAPAAWFLSQAPEVGHLVTDPLWRVPMLYASCLLAILVSRGLFFVFNRVDERSRIILFLPLQVSKGLGLVAFLGLPLSAAGEAALVAVPVARWIPYIIYRMGGMRWKTPDQLVRLILFLLILGAVSAWYGPEVFSDLTTGLLVVWVLIKARHDLKGSWDQARWLPDKETVPPQKTSDSANMAQRIGSD